MRWPRGVRPQHSPHAGVSGRSSARPLSSSRNPRVLRQGVVLRDVRGSPRVLAAQPHPVGWHGGVPGAAAETGCANAGLVERRWISLRPAALRPAHNAAAECPPGAGGSPLPPHRVAGDGLRAGGIGATRAGPRVPGPAQLAIGRVNGGVGRPRVYNSMLMPFQQCAGNPASSICPDYRRQASRPSLEKQIGTAQRGATQFAAGGLDREDGE